MRRFYSFVLLSLICLISFSCKEDEPQADSETNNEDRTYEEAMVYYNELRDILIELTTSEGLTRTKNLPTSGVVAYEGVYVGIRTNSNTQTSDTELLFVADLTLTLDFSTGNYTGSITNFTTDLPEYDHPDGFATISGSIRGNDDLGGDEFGLRLRIDETALTQGERTANFDGATADKGRFYGNSAQYIAIGIQSTFVWTSGPDSGTTTGTSGHVYIQAKE